MFCTHCGTKFASLDRFCTECGATRSPEVQPTNAADMHYSFADESSFKALSKEPGAMVVFTHLGRLKGALGAEFNTFEALLRRYLGECGTSGAKRILLDAEANFLGSPCGPDWQSHVRLLSGAVEWLGTRNVEAGSVLIVGDEKVIPMPCLQNPVGADDDVDSDYPYSALSEVDPWELSLIHI